MSTARDSSQTFYYQLSPKIKGNITSKITISFLRITKIKRGVCLKDEKPQKGESCHQKLSSSVLNKKKMNIHINSILYICMDTELILIT